MSFCDLGRPVGKADPGADSVRWLHIELINLHGNGLPDQFDRNYDSEPVFLAHQNPFHAGHRTAVHTNAPADREERVWLESRILRELSLQDLDLCIWKRRGPPSEAHQVHDSGRLQHIQPFSWSDAYEQISRKNRKLQLFTAVFPPPDRFVQRQKILNSTPPHLLGDMLFVTRSCVSGKPARFSGIVGDWHRDCRSRHIDETIRILCHSADSFATLPTDRSHR
jgi:hypothetical protein